MTLGACPGEAVTRSQTLGGPERQKLMFSPFWGPESEILTPRACSLPGRRGAGACLSRLWTFAGSLRSSWACPHPGPHLCLYRAGPSVCLCPLFSYEDTWHRMRVPNPGGSHLQPFTLIAPAKTLIPEMLTFGGSQGTSIAGAAPQPTTNRTDLRPVPAICTAPQPIWVPQTPESDFVAGGAETMLQVSRRQGWGGCQLCQASSSAHGRLWRWGQWALQPGAGQQTAAAVGRARPGSRKETPLVGLRAWEACGRCVPTPHGPARAGLRFPALVARLGWGLPSAGPPVARLPGLCRNVLLLAEQSSFEPGPYRRLP